MLFRITEFISLLLLFFATLEYHLGFRNFGVLLLLYYYYYYYMTKLPWCS